MNWSDESVDALRRRIEGEINGGTLVFVLCVFVGVPLGLVAFFYALSKLGIIQ